MNREDDLRETRYTEGRTGAHPRTDAIEHGQVPEIVEPDHDTLPRAPVMPACPTPASGG
jgi:hypothetical protein